MNPVADEQVRGQAGVDERGDGHTGGPPAAEHRHPGELSHEQQTNQYLSDRYVLWWGIFGWDAHRAAPGAW